MTYAMAAALQVAVFDRLSADDVLRDLVGTAIFDQAPATGLSGLFVALGPEKVMARGDASGGGAVHDFEVLVASSSDGFLALKTVCVRICDVLAAPNLSISRGHLRDLTFLRAEAVRARGETSRRIKLTFRAQLDA